MRNYAYIMLLVVFLVGVASCGGSAGMSAPPISLPSPVTGRIVVSSPDSEGNITVIGQEGAVSESATVMAINAGAVSSLPQRFLDLLVKEAYAQTDSFPSICYESDHACALADETGAFELTIPGSEGDQIIIVEIDPDTGDEMSERLIREVPQNIFPFIRGPIDLAINPDGAHLHILLQGGVGVLNSIRTAQLEPWSIDPSAVEVGGERGVRMAASSANLAVADIGEIENSLFMSAIDPLDQSLAGFSQRILVNDITEEGYLVPSEMMFATYPVQGINKDFLILTNLTAKPSAYFLNLSEPGRDLGFDIDLGANKTHLGTVAVAETVYTWATGEPVKLLVFVSNFQTQNADGTTTETTELSLYNEGMISMWLFDPEIYPPIVETSVTLPAGTIASDVEFMDQNTIVVTDRGNNVIYFYDLSEVDFMLEIGSSPATLTFTELTDPRNIEVAKVGSSTYVFVILHNGTETWNDTVLTLRPEKDTSGILSFGTKLTPVGLSPSDLVFDPVNNYLYVSCFLSRNVARLELSEILPAE